MRVLILGGDGYLGWPTAMHFASAGYEVTVADNYLRRLMAEATKSEALVTAPTLTERATVFKDRFGREIAVRIGDLADPEFAFSVVKEVNPDCIVHYAEQPSAPYSMRGFEEARVTLKNNFDVTFNVIWAVNEYAPKCHIVKLGTMGEYGNPILI